jgi:hypothetical protein
VEHLAEVSIRALLVSPIPHFFSTVPLKLCLGGFFMRLGSSPWKNYERVAVAISLTTKVKECNRLWVLKNSIFFKIARIGGIENV